ncbi:MAG TPA: helix-turn-helix domain-containing protein [Niabella sp.]|nr:helix-turn-helix domain-containing protein [Niabella sp.]
MDHSITVKDKIGMDKTLKVAPFKKEVRTTSPHKHNSYFEIIFLTKGNGVHTIDSQDYEVKPPIVFFVRKEQIHFWNLTSEPEGYVLIIKKGFIESSLDKEIKPLLYKLSKFAAIELQEQETINCLFQLLTKEYATERSFTQDVIDGLIKSLLAKLLQQDAPANGGISVEGNLYGLFRELLSQEVAPRNNVAYYAAQLNTSPQNLNIACRKSGSLSAGDVLSEFIISEAKRHLIYTDNTISQIAFSLNFNDASHFIKYFKRFTGLTPVGFRRAHL